MLLSRHPKTAIVLAIKNPSGSSGEIYESELLKTARLANRLTRCKNALHQMLSLAQSYAEDLEEHQQKPEDAFVSQIQKRNEELEAENRKLRELMQAKGNGEVPDQN